MIEIVVVIAILGVISAIAVPKLSGFSEKAKIKSDTASLEVLNKATKLYGATNNINSEDVFEGVIPDEDEARIELLVEDGLLEKVIKAQEKGKKFQWDIDEQTWKIGDLDGSDEEEGGAEPDPEKTDEEIAAEKEESEKLAAEDKGFVLNKINGTYSIIGYDPIKGGSDPEIPEKIGEAPVTSIGTGSEGDGSGVFENKGLTSIKIPNSVTSISKYAFKGNKLTTATLLDGLTTIEDGVFSQNNLTSIDIPDSVTSIGDYAFDLNELTEITIGNSVKSIGNSAFKENRLTEVTIPDSVTSIYSEIPIWNSAFYGNGPKKSDGKLRQIKESGKWKIILGNWTKQR